MTLAEAPITAQPSSPSTVATPRRASPVSMVATVALIAAIGLGLGLLAGMLSKTSGRDLIGVDHVSQPVVAAVVILGLWTVLLVHELGHSIARFAQGNRFMQFAAGPLQVRRETGVVRVRFNRSAGLCGGVAASMPRVSAGATLKENLFRVALWGPLASLLLAAVTAAALRARVDQLADTSLDGVMLHLTRFEHALDVDDRPRAATHMAAVRAAREGLAPTLRSHVALESAYWVAVGKGAAACARQEFGDAAESPFTTKVSRVRTEGAVLLIEGDKSAWLACLEQAAALALVGAHDPAMRSECTRIERARLIA